MDNISKSKVVVNLLWKVLERTGTQGVTFITSIILARILAPEDFGTIVLITVFISIANVFVQSGLGTALIQNKDVSEEDFSTVFYTSFFISTLLYIILFLIAPTIEKFYNITNLADIIRVLSLTLFPFSLNAIQNAYIIRNMQFKKLFICSLGGIIVSGITGILMAFKGYGPWAIVGQQLSNSITVCIIMWFSVKWHPEFIFSFKRLKKLFSYGWKLLVANLLNTTYNEFFNLLVGKKYSTEILGYFNRGKQFPTLIVSNVDNAIQTVMLPVYSSQQDSREVLKKMLQMSIRLSSFLIFPAMGGLIAIAHPFISLVLTDKWLPSVVFLQIYCIFYAFIPIQTANLQAINALGRSDIFLKLEVIKKVLGLGILSITIFYGVIAIAIGVAISSILFMFINSYPIKKLLNYSYLEQMKDILPPLLLSVVMAIIVWYVNIFDLSNGYMLFTQIVIGVIFYVGVAYLLKIQIFMYLLGVLKGLLNRKQ